MEEKNIRPKMSEVSVVVIFVFLLVGVALFF